MRFRLRTLLLAILFVAGALSSLHWEDIYFRCKYGPRVPGRHIRYGPINDFSHSFRIYEEVYYLGESPELRSAMWAATTEQPGADLRLRGVWHTPFIDRPFVVKLGREVLFARPNEIHVHGDANPEKVPSSKQFQEP